jgi:predicted TPR repeat methyltransferase
VEEDADMHEMWPYLWLDIIGGITSQETRFAMAENVVTSVLVKLGLHGIALNEVLIRIETKTASGTSQVLIW